MTMNHQDHIAPPTTTYCGNCSAEERRLLHHVRHRGLFRRLCTSCVLKLHPQSFCPTCFLVYDRSPPLSSSDSLTCIKCYSSSHSHCVNPTPSPSPSTPYICPPCANPNLPIFNPKKTNDDCREIDKKAAKVLLAAAKIAAASMSKAAVAARAEAEKRAKEAAFTRKRAREALEHVSFLYAKEKLKRLSVEVSGSGTNSQKVGGLVERNNNNNNNRGGNQREVDGSNEVSARLNAVGLRENNNGAVVMAVEKSDRVRVSPPLNVEGGLVRNNSGHLEKNNGIGDKVNNGLHSDPRVGNEKGV